MGYDIQAAREAGIPDADIAASLAPKLNYDLDGAMKAGIAPKEIADALAAKFNSTSGGAAVGNPSIQAQGEAARRNSGEPTPVWQALTGAGVAGGVIGAVSGDVLSAGGRALSRAPNPMVSRVGMGVEAAGNMLKNSGRLSGAAMGATAGIAGEATGLAAETSGAGPVTAEAARFAGGGGAGVTVDAAKWALDKVLTAPALSVTKKLAKESAKLLMLKLGVAPETLSSAEEKYLKELVTSFRGSSSEQDLMNIGSLMANEGRRLTNNADMQLQNALRQSAGRVGAYGGATKELTDIGAEIRNIAIPKYEALDKAQKAAYRNTEQLRDSIVTQRESAGKYISDLPAYKAIVDEVQGQLDNSIAMNRSPSVQEGLRKLLADLTNKDVMDPTQKLVLSGQNLDLQEIPGVPKPIRFSALDDARRKLGETFSGKPDTGYAAITANEARYLYGKVRALQVEYAGGKGGPQDKLLADYAADIPGLQEFSSKIGKKITSLDQYREGVYATDPADIPKAFFRTASGYSALKNFLGSEAKVNAAALAYADKSLIGKDSAAVRKWMDSNSDWLTQSTTTRRLVDNYAGRLEVIERATKTAEDFGKKALSNNKMLVGKGVPAATAVDLIKSGDAEYWSLIAPVIAQSPQAKTDMVNAVRRVFGEMPNTATTVTTFNRNVRPFLENSGIATKAELDALSQKLTAMVELKISEKARIGLINRTLLNATMGWSATAASRTGFKSMQWMVPNQYENRPQ